MLYYGNVFSIWQIPIDVWLTTELWQSHLLRWTANAYNLPHTTMNAQKWIFVLSAVNLNAVHSNSSASGCGFGQFARFKRRAMCFSWKRITRMRPVRRKNRLFVDYLLVMLVTLFVSLSVVISHKPLRKQWTFFIPRWDWPLEVYLRHLEELPLRVERGKI